MQQQSEIQHHIAVLGGTGFVGRVLCRQLTEAGHKVRVLTRNANRHNDLESTPNLRVIGGAVTERRFLAQALTGCDVAINLTGIINETRRSGNDFHTVHVDLPRTLGRACHDASVGRVLHMSALGARAGSAPSRYLRSKGEGGNALQVELGSRIPWTIFRPSTIFGPGDDFTNRFTQLLRISPGFMPLPCPEARMAPVHVEDVAQAFVRSIDNPDSYRIRYALCGPHEYSLREIVAFLAEASGHRRRILSLPDGLSRLQATLMAAFPGKPFTRDNYMSLQVDSVCDPARTGDCAGMAALGIEPAAMEDIVPGYLRQRRPS